MTNPRMIMTDNEATNAISDILGPANRRHWIIFALILVGLSSILLEKRPIDKAEAGLIPRPPTPQTYFEATGPAPVTQPVMVDQPAPAPIQAPAAIVDPFARYADDLVAHPGRQPDALVLIKVSRYDPALGGTNCFRWGNGTCLSPLANGERWESNYGIAIACPSVWPFGAIVEIGGRLWVCKDRGGKIVQARPGVFWVDQLSTVAYYPHGAEMEASVWWH